MKRAKLNITGTISCVKFCFFLEKAKWLKRSLFLRPFADASTATLSSGRCEERHMMLPTFTMGSTIGKLHC